MVSLTDSSNSYLSFFHVRYWDVFFRSNGKEMLGEMHNNLMERK